MALILTVGFDVSKNEDKIRKQLDAAITNMSETQLTNFSSRVSGLTDIINEVAREAVSGVSTSASTVTAPVIPAAPAVPPASTASISTVPPQSVTPVASAVTGSTALPVTTTPASSAPVDSYSMIKSTLYYESQTEPQSCGRHALNNMIGRKAFVNVGGTVINDTNISTAKEPINLPSICAYLQSKIDKSTVDFECSPDEDYDIKTLTAALNILGYESIENNGYDNTCRPSCDNTLRIHKYALFNLGPIEKANAGHWISVRIVKGNFYLFDSINPTRDSDVLPAFRRAFIFSRTGKYIDPLAIYKKSGFVTSSTSSAPPAAALPAGIPSLPPIAPLPTGSIGTPPPQMDPSLLPPAPTGTTGTAPPASVSTGTTGTAPPAAAPPARGTTPTRGKKASRGSRGRRGRGGKRTTYRAKRHM